MLRALILAALICVCGILASTPAEARTVNRQPPTPNHHSNVDTDTATTTTISVANAATAMNMIPKRTTTTTTNTNKATPSTDENNDERYPHYHPAEDLKPHLIEQFHHQHADGTYEFKYVLSNGVTRYEKSYWKPIGKGEKMLARKGFYSHPLSNGKYLTVFYTADEHGFRQDTAKYSNEVPTLPKRLDIPQMEYPKEVNKPHFITTTITPYTTRRTTTTTTTRRTTTTPRTTTQRTTTRKPRFTTTARPLVEPTKFNWIY